MASADSPMSMMMASMMPSLPDIMPPLQHWEKQYSGFDKSVLILQTISPEYICGICSQLLKKPYQSFCGHRYCMVCILNLMKGKNTIACPVCLQEPEETRMEADYIMVTQETLHPDNAVRRMMYRQKAQCINKNCDWKGTFGDYDGQHYENCRFHVITCSLCNVEIFLDNLRQHEEEECTGREITCKFCSDKIPGNIMQKHIDFLCPKIPMDCESCGTAGILRENLKDHYSGECVLRKIPCPYGCPFTFLEEKGEQCDHERHYLLQHTQQMLQKINAFENTRSGGRVNADTLSQIDTIKRRMEQVDFQLANQPSGHILSSTTPAPPRQSNTTQIAHLTNNLQQLSEKTDSHLEKIAVIENGVENNSVQSYKHEESHLMFNRTMGGQIKQAERHVSIQDMSEKELKERVTLLEECRRDGTIIWKISDFKQKLTEAKQGRNLSHYSPPFYSSKYGYKMGLRIYLNGDGMGKGTHVSLFFVVMKGEYDALLKWPFRQKVTFSLISQNPDGKDVKDSFKPDPSSTSFQRPRSEMNIASGCPFFCHQNQLTDANGFLKNDTLFLQATVDTEGLGLDHGM